MVDYLKFDTLDDSIGFKFARTYLAMRHVLNLNLKELNLHHITVEQTGILKRLVEKDGLFQRELADNQIKHKANITRMLDILEKKEMIIRKADSFDRRKFRIFITDQGRAHVGKVMPAMFDTLSYVFKDFTEEEIMTLKSSLDRIYDHIAVDDRTAKKVDT